MKYQVHHQNRLDHKDTRLCFEFEPPTTLEDAVKKAEKEYPHSRGFQYLFCGEGSEYYESNLA